MQIFFENPHDSHHFFNFLAHCTHSSLFTGNTAVDSATKKIRFYLVYKINLFIFAAKEQAMTRGACFLDIDSL